MREEAFYAAIAAHPDDCLPREVFADWLEERAGTEACPECTEGYLYHGGVQGMRCVTCSGAGRVPDRHARLAQGYRALGEFGKSAYKSSGEDSFWYWSMFTMREPEFKMDDGYDLSHHLPVPWMNTIGRLNGDAQNGYADPHRGDCRHWPASWGNTSRRFVEDAAALAWSAMTEREQQACARELRGEEVPA